MKRTWLILNSSEMNPNLRASLHAKQQDQDGFRRILSARDRLERNRGLRDLASPMETATHAASLVRCKVKIRGRALSGYAMS